MDSQSLVQLFCLLLALSAIQGMKVMTFQVRNEARATTQGYMLGNSKITERFATIAMRNAYDFIKNGIYKQEDPFRKKEIGQITLKIIKGKLKSDFVISNQEILVSVDYFKSGDTKTLKQDFKRNIHHAMTLEFLSVDGIQKPDELIKGIADFIVLESGLAPADWAKPGQGNKWSERSDITAQFFHFCDITSKGFVAILIKNYKIEEYQSGLDDFLQTWWDKYKKHYQV